MDKKKAIVFARRMFCVLLVFAMLLPTLGFSAEEGVQTSSTEKAVKTKQDLQSLMAPYDKTFTDETIYDYSNKAQTDMLNALEFCNNTLANESSGDDDFTVAYYMLSAAAKKLVKYSIEDLKDYVSKCKTAYNTGNLLNKQNDDKIFEESAYEAFTTAYDNAEFLSTSDSGLLSNTYQELYDTYHYMLDNRLETVSATQLKKLIKELDNFEKKKNNYEQWRRGTVTSPQTNKVVDSVSEDAINFHPLTWGDLFNSNKEILVAPDGSLIYTVAHFGQQFKSKSEFILSLSSQKTSNKEIVDLYNKAKAALDAATSFEPDTFSESGRNGVNRLIDKNTKKLIALYGLQKSQSTCCVEFSTVEDIANAIAAATNMTVEELFTRTTLSTEMSFSEAAPIVYISYDLNTMEFISASTVRPETGRYKAYKNGDSIKLYEYVHFKKAVLAENYKEMPSNVLLAFMASFSYMDRNYGNYMEQLAPETVKTSRGNDEEWEVIYRFLQYAIDDEFGLNEKTRSLAELKAALEKSYEADNYAGFPLFDGMLRDIADIRSIASAFYKKAITTPNYTSDMALDGVVATIDGEETRLSWLTATELYNVLVWEENTAAFLYAVPDKMLTGVGVFCYTLQNYPASFGEIYDEVGKSAAIADERLSTDEITEKLEDVAYYLLDCKNVTNDFPKTAAWDGTLTLQRQNRIVYFEKGTECYVPEHDRLFEAYNSLLTATEKIKKDTIVSDIDVPLSNTKVDIVIKADNIANSAEELAISAVSPASEELFKKAAGTAPVIFMANISFKKTIEFHQGVEMGISNIGAIPGVEFTLVHEVTQGELEYFYANANNDGVLSFKEINGLSPFMLVKGRLEPLSETEPQPQEPSQPVTPTKDVEPGGEQEKSPPTADCNSVLLWAVMFVACTSALSLLIIKKRKAKR